MLPRLPEPRVRAAAGTAALPTRSLWLRRGWTMTALLGGLALLGPGCRSSKPDPSLPIPAGWLPSQGLVTEVQGSDCRARKPGASWHKLRSGEWLPAGTWIEAGVSSRLAVQLYEPGIKVQVKPGSLLQLEKLSYLRREEGLLTSTVLDLQQGEVAVDSSNLTAGSEFEIRSPQGVTHIPPPGAK
jgi:hypothetical protein